MSDAKTLVDVTEHPHGFSRLHLTPWDLSGDVSENDRELKLGKSFDGGTALAIYSWDKKKGRSQSADGITGESKGKWTSYGCLEPDNWAYRPHTRRTKSGKDNTWDLRLVSDRQNKDYERLHRSTMVIDQCKSQTWAWVRDALGVVKIDGGAPVNHEELYFDGAGQLTGLKHYAPKDKDKRGTLSLMISKTSGYISDYLRAAQLWHILHLSPNEAGTAVLDAGGCGDVTKMQGTLRGDVRYDVAGEIASLAFGPLPEITGGKRLTGMHFVYLPSEKPPAYELNTEESVSNQKILPRKEQKGIWVYVQQPEEWYPVRPPTVTPGSYPGRPGGFTGAPATSSQAGYVGDLFAKANLEGYTTTIDIPETLVSTWGINVAVDFLVPAAGWGGNGAEFQFDALVTALGVAPAGAVTQSTQKTVNATSYGTNGAIARVMYFVTPANLAGKRGGKISATLYRRTDRDTFAGDVLVLGMFTSFGPQITRIA